MQNIDNGLKSKISQLLYDDFIGDQDPEVPRDEYDPEAEKLLSWILEVSELNDKAISIALTNVMHDQLGYDFTPHQIQEGAYPETARRILAVVREYK